jgi:hypothetical protein
MSQVRPDSVLQDLQYVGDVEAKRQRYYVYSREEGYLVLSVSHSRPGSYNLNFIEKDALEFIRRQFSRRRGITSQTMAREAIAPVFFSRMNDIEKRLRILNICYVLVALGHAKLRKREGSRELKFDIH